MENLEDKDEYGSNRELIPAEEKKKRIRTNNPSHHEDARRKRK